MRKLMWIAIGFTAACLFGVYLVSAVWLPLAGGICLGVGTLLYFLKTVWSGRAFLCSVGFLCGLVWVWGFSLLYWNTARNYNGETQMLPVTVSDYSVQTDYGMYVQGKVELDGKKYGVRLYQDEYTDLTPGDQINGTFYLRCTLPASGEAPSHHSGKGIFFLLYSTDDPEISYGKQLHWTHYPAILRREITNLLDNLFPEDTLGFARALLLGDDSLLSYKADKALQISGIRHVIAVSGLHVSILFGLVYTLCARHRVLTTIIGFPLLLLFAAIAGFTPSIIRACVMQALMILALLINKEYDPPTALSLAALAILVWNPMAISSVSFQLSVGCMVGIFLFSERIMNGFSQKDSSGKEKKRSISVRLKKWMASSVAVTLSAMVVTTPLCAAYFGMVSLVGILTNLLTLWVISFVFYGIIAACLAGLIYAPVGQGIAWAVSFPMRYVLGVSQTLSEFSLAAVYTCSVYIVAWITFAYVLLLVFLCMSKRQLVLFSVCLLLSLFASVVFTRLEGIQESYRVTVLDVGQGQSVILQCREQTYLVDCGGDSPEIAADTASMHLLSQGITGLDGLILTHYDTDHAGGTLALMSRFPVKTLYLPDINDENGLREKIEAAANAPISWVREDIQLSLPEGQMGLFAGYQQEDDNESGLCVLFQAADCDILITGDRGFEGEMHLLEMASIPELELLVVGHHGSKTSTGLNFLKQTLPAAAAISVGADNSYGHPAEETLLRLELFDCQVYRTDQQGTLVFRGE